MKILFISQNLPGQMEPIAREFARDPSNMVLMASMRHRSQAPPFPIRRIMLKKCNVEKYEKNYIGYLELAMRTAQNAGSAWKSMLNDNIYPDLICISASNGIAFGLNEFFPDSLKVSYFESSLLASADNGLTAARHLIQEQQFKESDLIYARNEEQLQDLPAGLTARMLPAFTDTAWFAPSKTPGRDILLYCGLKPALNLNRLLEDLATWMQSNPGVRLRIIAENALQPAARPAFTERFNPDVRDRIEIVRAASREAWRDILAKSAICICAGADAWPEQRLLDTMSAGVCIATANASQLLQPSLNCLHPPGKQKAWLGLLDMAARGELADTGLKGREYVKARHAEAAILPRHIDELLAAAKQNSLAASVS